MEYGPVSAAADELLKVVLVLNYGQSVRGRWPSEQSTKGLSGAFSGSPRLCETPCATVPGS
eukprot:3578845-Alexandrium_andersonii.AAC.1